MGNNYDSNQGGNVLVTVICCIVIWGITLLLWCFAGNVGVVVMLICSVFGWKKLNQIQPSMFIWMPIVGWLIYFLIKFIISAFVGLFVAPFTIGTMIAEQINGAANS